MVKKTVSRNELKKADATIVAIMRDILELHDEGWTAPGEVSRLLYERLLSGGIIDQV